MFIVCQFAILNFPSIMQALKKVLSKCEAYNVFTNRQKCAILLHILLQTCQENIYNFERHITLNSSTNPFSVLFSILFYSPVRLLVIPIVEYMRLHKFLQSNKMRNVTFTGFDIQHFPHLPKGMCT